MRATKVMKKPAATEATKVLKKAAMKAMKKKEAIKAKKDETVWDCAGCLGNIPPGWKNKACVTAP